MLSDYLLGPLKRYLTQTLSTSLSKYISNINVDTLGVGGDIILRDLELRLDVLQESLKIPLAFEFSRGFIKELRIQIHWTKLMSQPIHVKVSTIEIILTARSELQFRRLQLAYQRHTSKSGADSSQDAKAAHAAAKTTAKSGKLANGTPTPGHKSGTNGAGPQSPSRASSATTAAAGGGGGGGAAANTMAGAGTDSSESGGWLHDAIRKIIANATVEINDLVLKYEHANVVLSTSFRSLRVSSADPSQGWKVAFQEPKGVNRSIFKAIDVRDLTINLDRIHGESSRRISLGVISISDMHIRKLDLSVSNEQFIMLEELMVLPDDEDSVGDSDASAAAPSGEKGDADTTSPASPSSASSSSSDSSDLSNSSDASSSSPSSLVSVDETQKQDAVRENIERDLEASAEQAIEKEGVAGVAVESTAAESQEGGWGSWAWGVLVGDVEQELDDVEVEMLYDAAETAKRREAARMQAARLARERKRLLVVAGTRVDSISFTFLVHKETREDNTKHTAQGNATLNQTSMTSALFGDDSALTIDEEGGDREDGGEFVSVPVANVGMVKVRLDRTQQGSILPQRRQKLAGTRLDELLRFAVQGITLEVRKVDDLIEDHTKAFVDIYADVDLVRICRLEAATSVSHDVALWGESTEFTGNTNSAILDAMPHPWFCWSFFNSANGMATYPEHCEKECCVGTSLYRRSDKALRFHCHAPTGQLNPPTSSGNPTVDVDTPALSPATAPIYVDAAVGPVSCRLDLLSVEGIYEFFGLSAASPDELGTRSGLPELRKGTAGAALKELAAEYSSLTRPQQLQRVSRPVEVLASFPKIVGELSTVPPGATREEAHSCLGLLVRDTVLRMDLARFLAQANLMHVCQAVEVVGAVLRPISSAAAAPVDPLFLQKEAPLLPGIALNLDTLRADMSVDGLAKGLASAAFSLGGASLQCQGTTVLSLRTPKGKAAVALSGHVFGEGHPVTASLQRIKAASRFLSKSVVARFHAEQRTVEARLGFGATLGVTHLDAIGGHGLLVWIWQARSRIADILKVYVGQDRNRAAEELFVPENPFPDDRAAPVDSGETAVYNDIPVRPRRSSSLLPWVQGTRVFVHIDAREGEAYITSKVMMKVPAISLVQNGREHNDFRWKAGPLALCVRGHRGGLRRVLRDAHFHGSCSCALGEAVELRLSIICDQLQMDLDPERLLVLSAVLDSPLFKGGAHFLQKTKEADSPSSNARDNGTQGVSKALTRSSIAVAAKHPDEMDWPLIVLNIQGDLAGVHLNLFPHARMSGVQAHVGTPYQIAENIEFVMEHLYFSLRQDTSSLAVRVTVRDLCAFERLRSSSRSPFDDSTSADDATGLSSLPASAIGAIVAFLPAHDIVSLATAFGVPLSSTQTTRATQAMTDMLSLQPRNEDDAFFEALDLSVPVACSPSIDEVPTNKPTLLSCAVIKPTNGRLLVEGGLLPLDFVMRPGLIAALLFAYHRDVAVKGSPVMLPFSVRMMIGPSGHLELACDEVKIQVAVNQIRQLQTLLGEVATLTNKAHLAFLLNDSLSVREAIFQNVLLQGPDRAVLPSAEEKPVEETATSEDLVVTRDPLFSISASVPGVEVRVLDDETAEVARVWVSEMRLSSSKDTMFEIMDWGLDAGGRKSVVAPLKGSSPSLSASMPQGVSSCVVELPRGLLISADAGLVQAVTRHFPLEPFAAQSDETIKASVKFHTFVKARKLLATAQTDNTPREEVEAGAHVRMTLKFVLASFDARLHLTESSSSPGLRLTADQDNFYFFKLPTPRTNDFASLKRIYEMDNNSEYVHPAPGQIVLGALGMPGSLAGSEQMWSAANPVDATQGLQAGGQWKRSFAPLSTSSMSDWVTLRWQYFEPRKLERIRLLNAPPIPRGVADAAIHPTGLEASVVECQLAYWDAIQGCYVVVAHFNVPLEEEALASPWRRPGVEDFVDAFSNLVDMSMVDDATNIDPAEDSDQEGGLLGARKKLHASTFPLQIRRSAASKSWILRWHAAETVDRESLPVDDRLAVCSALVRSLCVESACSDAFWYPMEIHVSARRLGLAVLRQADLNSRKEEMLFVLRARNFGVHLQQRPRERERVRVSADLDVHVQDFGHLALLHFARVHHLAVVYEKSTASRAESVWIDCRHWRWNISKQTLPAVHFAVQSFAHDMEKLLFRRDEIAKEANVQIGSGPPTSGKFTPADNQEQTRGDGGGEDKDDNNNDDDASLQYRIVNSTGRTVWFGQYGTAEVIRVDSEKTRSYSWRVTSTHLMPHAKDHTLVRYGRKESEFANLDASLRAQIERAAEFIPLMRFALSSDRSDDEPGTWTRPTSIDNIGVHLRSLVFGGVNKNAKSVFFGNEPQSRLWVSAQRGENGLQTIVRLLPSHFVVSRVPEPLQIRFASSTREVPACDAKVLRETFARAKGHDDGDDEDMDSPIHGVQVERLQRMSSSSSVASVGPGHSDSFSGSGGQKSHGTRVSKRQNSTEPLNRGGDHSPVGYIDEKEFDFSFAGAGTLPLMCPDVNLLASMDDATQEKADREMSIQIGRQIDWSAPISLLKVDGRSAPQLVEVPGPLGVSSMWLWVHVRRAHIRSPQGGRLRSWVMVEIWPTAYLCNDAPWPLLCRIRPQTRLELLQYAMVKHEEDFSKGYWPLVKSEHQHGNTENSTLGRATPTEEGRGEIRVQTVEPNTIAALFLHPTRSQALIVSSAAGEGSRGEASDSLAGSPALRIHEPLFANCITAFGASMYATGTRLRMALAHHEAHLRGGMITMQASAVSGFASLFIRASAPMCLRNESRSKLHFRCGDEVVSVDQGASVPVAWWPKSSLGSIEDDDFHMMELCLGRECIGQDEETIAWSSPLPLSDDDQHIVAIPVLESVKDAEHAAWVSQYWCDMSREEDGRLIITTRDRIMVHNRMKGPPVRLRVESPFSEALDFVEIAESEAWSPMSYFCDVSAGTLPGLANKEEEKDGVQTESASRSDGSNTTRPASERRSSGFSTWILNRSQRSASASSVSSLLGLGSGLGASQSGSNANSEAGDSPEQKLLSTVLRLNTTAAPGVWTEPIPVSSLDIAQGWKQLVQLHVGPTHVETITCICNEVDGVVHVVLQRETQPECIVMNKSANFLSVGLGNASQQHKWTSGQARGSCWGLYLAPKHSATVNWLALSQRVRKPLFEVMRQNVDDSTSEYAGGEMVPAAETILSSAAASPQARGRMSPVVMDGPAVQEESLGDEDDPAKLAMQLHVSLARQRLVRDEYLCVIEEDDPAWLRKPSEVFEGQQRKDRLLLFQRHKFTNTGLGSWDGVVREIDTGSALEMDDKTQTGKAVPSVKVETRFLQRETGTKILPLERYRVVMSRPHAWWEISVHDVNSAPALDLQAGAKDAGSLGEIETTDGADVQSSSLDDAGSSSYVKTKSLQVLATVSDLEVCLFDQSLETVHLRVAGVEVSHIMQESRASESWRELSVQHTTAGRAQWIQMDSFVPESEIPVVMHFVESEDDGETEVALCKFGYNDPRSAAKSFREAWAVRDRVLAGASWTEVTCAGHKLPKQFGKVHLRLAPLTVAVEDALLKRLASSLMPIAATLIAQQKLLALRKGKYTEVKAKSVCPTQLVDVDDRIFIENLVIGELSVIATVRTTTLPMFVGIDRTPLRFSEVSLVRVFEGAKALRNELAANYIADALLGSPALLGSLEILGNPVGFARSVGAGVYDLVFQPLKAIRHGYGPGGILRGVARGWSSLLIHLSEGALMSVSGFSNSIARNLDRLSLDAAYATRREQMRRRRTHSSGGARALSMRLAVVLREALNEQEENTGYWVGGRDADEQASFRESHGNGQGSSSQEQVTLRHLRDFSVGLGGPRESMRYGTARGLARGVVGLGQGMFGAATGIVVQPFEVASQQGWGVGSVLQGVGRGLLGAVTKPIGGAADLVAQTSGGIMQDVGIGAAAGPPIMRERSMLTSAPHHALRFDWKLLPQHERYVHHERAQQQYGSAPHVQRRLVLVVVTTEAFRLFSVLDGTDTLPILDLAWPQVAALDSSFRDPLVLSVRVEPGAGRDLVLVFASKQDRRLLVKEAVTLQRHARAISR
ncbi:Vacuolar protein sorting-associated protein 13B [Hondaea fermentalgiana]|uniref:Vacuolar protein sorting-associated protein 13B n=1 Tax=Hondaea fermentalgiana TaxID=2315210 RepID=A0A2R5GB42_9STRA|nr:Vacuolar protein sorting-associated protein 13B [Hondaea fermentalgiana]|eukprot:GBG27559.1 Vacuolar protein sorting-associated protein 13B [Hondaea fermentalgiana]